MRRVRTNTNAGVDEAFGEAWRGDCRQRRRRSQPSAHGDAANPPALTLEGGPTSLRVCRPPDPVTTTRRTLAQGTRSLPWIVCLTLLFVLVATPRREATVCLARLGLAAASRVAATPEPEPTCPCCRARAARPLPPAPLDERLPGEERIGPDGSRACCVHLQADLELGPLPRSDRPSVPAAIAIAGGGTEPVVPSADPGGDVVTFDTGPPRTDQRTALRSTVVLRL